MCLAVPGKIVGIENDELRMGRVSFAGITKRICLEYVPEAEPGDYVLAHAGFAIGRLDEAEARRVLETFDAIERAEAEGSGAP
jgi:hydrogenase expression/formation protein HypC